MVLQKLTALLTKSLSHMSGGLISFSTDQVRQPNDELPSELAPGYATMLVGVSGVEKLYFWQVYTNFHLHPTMLYLTSALTSCRTLTLAWLQKSTESIFSRTNMMSCPWIIWSGCLSVRQHLTIQGRRLMTRWSGNLQKRSLVRRFQCLLWHSVMLSCSTLGSRSPVKWWARSFWLQWCRRRLGLVLSNQGSLWNCCFILWWPTFPAESELRKRRTGPCGMRSSVLLYIMSMR